MQAQTMQRKVLRTICPDAKGLIAKITNICYKHELNIVQNNEFVVRAEKLMGDHYHVYALPFEKGKKVLVAQGYESLFSHYGDYAIDFKVAEGTKIMAARDGVGLDTVPARWGSYVERQDLNGFDRDRVRDLGLDYLTKAVEESA